MLPFFVLFINFREFYSKVAVTEKENVHPVENGHSYIAIDHMGRRIRK